MADVRSIKQRITEDNCIPVSADLNNPLRGQVSAYIMVEAIGFNGAKVFRRVRIGYEHSVTPDIARNMVDNLRQANTDAANYNNPPIITGRFIMDL